MAKRPARIHKRDKPGRPEIKVDWTKVDRLLIAHCSGVEVAADLGICPETLYRKCEEDHNLNFTVYRTSKMDKGKSLLKAAQMDSAINGSNQMLIHLGEHILGQGKKEEAAAAPNEDAITTRHALMAALAKIDKLEEQLNAYKPQAEQELRGSHAPF